MNEIIDTTARTPSTIAAEIRFLDKQAATTCIQFIIEIGRRLVEAKAMVGDGNWLQYIKTELNYERSTANNYMKLYERFGTGQASMFGSFADSQTFGELTYTKALALLKVPEEELEEFAETHDISAMSTRELQEAIRQKDKAEEDARRYREQRDQAVEDAQDLRRERDENLVELVEAQGRAEKAEAQVERLTAGMEQAAQKLEDRDVLEEKLRTELEEARDREKKALAALEKAKASPEVPEAMLESIRQEAEAEAAKKAAEAVEEKLAKVAKEKQALTEQLARKEEELDKARKEARLGDPDVAVFKTLFAGVQDDFNQLHGVLLKIRAEDREMGDKLTNAVRALIGKLEKDIS